MTRRALCKNVLRRIVLPAALLLLAMPPLAAQDLVKSGDVKIEQVQIAFIGSANLGGGTLHFNGKEYPFSIGGLGIGGFGASKIEAVGEVYNMTDPSQFAGAYGQARYGAVVGELSTGELWLQNNSGVYMHLRAEREGLMLSLGGDVIYIDLE